MADARRRRIVVLGLILVAGIGGSLLLRSEPPAPITGVVRATEIRLAPEVGGQLATIKVEKGARVRVGDVVAELSALELTASVGQARAALEAATASRDHVYAGVRAEQVAALAAEIAKAKSKLTYVEAQLVRVSTLVRGDFASQQALDQATNDVAAARADVAEAEANHAAAVAGPTQEERAIADAPARPRVPARANRDLPAHPGGKLDAGRKLARSFRRRRMRDVRMAACKPRRWLCYTGYGVS